MSSVTTINLLDLVDAIGEEETKNLHDPSGDR